MFVVTQPSGLVSAHDTVTVIGSPPAPGITTVRFVELPVAFENVNVTPAVADVSVQAYVWLAVVRSVVRLYGYDVLLQMSKPLSCATLLIRTAFVGGFGLTVYDVTGDSVLSQLSLRLLHTIST